MPHFDEFRHVVKYKKKIKGAVVTEKGGNPQTISQDQLEELLGPLEEKGIEIRLDPLFGRYSLHTTLISEERSKKPIVAKPGTPSDSSSCDFCKPRVYQETATPKIYHSQQIVTTENLFPYISPLFVTIFKNEHKPDSEDLTGEDIAAYLSSGIELAHRIQRKGCDGMLDFINWGKEAGASQPHPHAQRGGLYRFMRTLMDKESEALEKRKSEIGGKDPFEDYMERLRDSPLLVYEDDGVFVFAPFAPRFTDQIDIYTKRRDSAVSNFLELRLGDIAPISGIMVKVLRYLRRKGVTDFNLVTHQSRFNCSSGYRMHWHIYPRIGSKGPNLIGSPELNDLYTVSAYPENTAKALALDLSP